MKRKDCVYWETEVLTCFGQNCSDDLLYLPWVFMEKRRKEYRYKKGQQQGGPKGNKDVVSFGCYRPAVD